MHFCKPVSILWLVSNWCFVCFGVLNAVACTISSNRAWGRTPTGKIGRGRQPRFGWLGTRPMIINLPPSWGDEMNNVVQRKTQWGEGWAKPDVAVCEARPTRQAWNHGLLLPCRGCLNAQRRPDGHSASHLQHVFSGAAGGLCNHRDYIQHAQLLKHQTWYTNCYCKGAELGWESGSSHWFFHHLQPSVDPKFLPAKIYPLFRSTECASTVFSAHSMPLLNGLV